MEPIRLLFFLLMLINTNLFAGVETFIIPTLNSELPGKNHFNNENITVTAKTTLGLSLGGELRFHVTRGVHLGTGFTYQFNRQAQIDLAEGSFKFMPFYLSLSGTIIESDEISPIITGHLGNNTFSGTEHYKGDFGLGGGLYYAIGIDFKLYNQVQLSILYKSNNGRASRLFGATSQSVNVEYAYFSLSFGFLIRIKALRKS